MTAYADSGLPDMGRSRPHVGVGRLPGRAWVVLVAAFRMWRLRARQRRELMMLSQPELCDMRLNEAAVDSEARKAFWQRVDLPTQD